MSECVCVCVLRLLLLAEVPRVALNNSFGGNEPPSPLQCGGADPSV